MTKRPSFYLKQNILVHYMNKYCMLFKSLSTTYRKVTLLCITEYIIRRENYLFFVLYESYLEQVCFNQSTYEKPARALCVLILNENLS